LEDGRTVSHSKEHYQGFEQTSIGPEGCLLLVSGLNADIVETPADIQLGKVSGSTELGHEFGDEGKGVLVLDRHRIECTIELPIAPESKSALTEYTSLVSVVLTSIGRIIDVPRASRVLTESCLSNLFSHFGFWGCVVLSGVEEEREGAFIGSLISVLTSSTSNTANLLTSSDRGALFASRAKQNPPLGLSKLLLLLLHPSGPLNLQSVPPFALR